LTIDEFEKRVKSGDQLVILNDMVLNVEKFKENHPGGKFSIQ
jgi:cytochrome b involved in lipid metabolism